MSDVMGAIEYVCQLQKERNDLAARVKTLEEREACAKIADEFGAWPFAHEISKAIRARGDGGENGELLKALAESSRREAELRESLKALRFGLGELGSY